jgi:sugar diacid utilization regulator
VHVASGLPGDGLTGFRLSHRQDAERSVAAVARTLHIAKNTVLYRVRKAERLRGRPLGEDRLRLHAALHLISAMRLT